MPIHTIGQPSNAVRNVDMDDAHPLGGGRPGEHSPGASGSEVTGFLATNLPRDKEGGGGVASGSKSSKGSERELCNREMYILHLCIAFVFLFAQK